MKVRNWWILETGFLASESDPSPTLGKIADLNFPDEYSPSIFLTGDGHRSPPFQWVTKNDWRASFASSSKTTRSASTWSNTRRT